MTNIEKEEIKNVVLCELMQQMMEQQEICHVEILTKEDLLHIFPWKLTKLNQLLRANILPVIKIGSDYITTPKQIQEWLKVHEGKEIFYGD